MWLLDGALQLQPFMFTSGLAHQIIAPAASGQPFFVAAPVMWNARLISAHPALFNALFAGVQLGLGLGFFLGRAVRSVIVASVAWAVGVWWLGEGLGGLAGAHATALVGTPGAALLYAVLALSAWPVRSRVSHEPGVLAAQSPPRWIIWVWGALWIGYAFEGSLPGNVHPADLANQLTANATSVPAWLQHIDRWLSAAVRSAGTPLAALMVAIPLAIGLLAFSQSRMRSAAVYVGMVLAVVYWAVGQSFGDLFSGQATDPSTGPLVILLGLAAVGAIRQDRNHSLELTHLGGPDLERNQSEVRVYAQLGG
jgi:hypothetical protein